MFLKCHHLVSRHEVEGLVTGYPAPGYRVTVYPALTRTRKYPVNRKFMGIEALYMLIYRKCVPRRLQKVSCQAMCAPRRLQYAPPPSQYRKKGDCSATPFFISNLILLNNLQTWCTAVTRLS